MDQQAKLIAKISAGDRERILEATEQILRDDMYELDVKKLHGSEKIFRVRVGSYRIKYEATSKGNVVIDVTRRNDNTYRK